MLGIMYMCIYEKFIYVWNVHIMTQKYTESKVLWYNISRMKQIST